MKSCFKEWFTFQFKNIFCECRLHERSLFITARGFRAVWDFRPVSMSPLIKFKDSINCQMDTKTPLEFEQLLVSVNFYFSVISLNQFVVPKAELL